MNSAGNNRQTLLNPAELLCKRWRELINVHLPVFERDSIWRYSRLRESNEPEQGWKLHVSATILTAGEVLKTVAPFLKKLNVFYKAPVSLHELKKLNAGIYYDYSQIGKFLTIYPQSDEQSAELAARLDRLTPRFSAPTIPFETRYKFGSSIYYRYGAFKINELKKADGNVVLAVRDENGVLVPDVRAAFESPPNKVENPFPIPVGKDNAANDSPLVRHYRIFRALSQRGKGGVYEGLDLRESVPRRCLLKEGRKNGEVEWNGRDGFWRVRHEAAVLENLRRAGLSVPQIYSTFEAENNFYLATEYVAGVNLHVFLKRKRRRLNIPQAIDFAVRLTAIIARLHAAGWFWRDCKPANLIVTDTGELRPLDFEGACLIGEPDAVSWSSLTNESADKRENRRRQTSPFVDLYALGAIIYLLFEGELPLAANGEIPVIKRRNVPAQIKRIVSSLLDPLTSNLTAAEIERRLKSVGNGIVTRRA